MMRLRRAALAAGLLMTLGAASPPAPAGTGVTVTLLGVRNAKGVVRLCLTTQAARFLECKNERAAMSLTVPASKAGPLWLGPVQPGTYALLVIHDQNSNERLDMMMGIPREGFGFSNNPTIRMRAPKWDEVRFNVHAGQNQQNIRVKYVL